MLEFFSQFLRYFLKEVSERFGSRNSVGSLFHTVVAFDENDDIVELRRHLGGRKIFWEWERVLLSGVQLSQMDENVCGMVLWCMDFLNSMAID